MPPVTSPGAGDPIVVATDLTKVYGDNRAVDGISFSISSGESFGLLGPNGAGKSTTMRMIGGTLTYDWHNGEPRFRHEVTLWPHARADTGSPTYRDMAPVSVTYADVPDYLTIRELQTINRIMED